MSHTGSFGWDVSTGKIYWSQETFRILEYHPPTEPTLELVLHRTHPEDKAPVQQVLDRVSRERKDFDFEHRLLMPKLMDPFKYLRVVGRSSKDESGSSEFMGAVMDISDLKRAEETRAAMARERELFAQQRATELAKANEALRGCIEALASVPELDDFLGLQVLQSMALGKTNKEIGQVLYISENTAKGHVKSILKKLDAVGRTEAIAIANRRGIIHTS